MNMDINQQIEIMEAQLNSKQTNFTLMEKMQYLTTFFGPDPEFSKEAEDMVRHNICVQLKKDKI